jgi:hypothetical protein
MRKIWIVAFIGLLCFPAFGGISISTDGGNRTVTLEYTSTIEKVSTTLEKLAEIFYVYEGIGHVFDNGAIVPFDDLTNVQKLHVVDVGVRQYLVQKARDFYINSVIESARITAENEDIFIEEEE